MAAMVGALAVGVSLRTRASRDPLAASPSTTDAEAIQALRNEVERLRKAVAMSSAAASSAANSAVAAQAQLSDLKSHVAEGRSDGEKTKPGLSAREFGERIDQRYDAQPRDQHWSRDAEITARKRLEMELPAGAEIRDVGCRQTLCRGRLRYSDRDSYSHYVEKLSRTPGNDWSGTAWHVIADRGEGGVDAAIYFMRVGTNALASLDSDDPPPSTEATP